MLYVDDILKAAMNVVDAQDGLTKHVIGHEKGEKLVKENRNLPSKPAFVKPRSCTQLFPTKLKTMFHETSE